MIEYTTKTEILKGIIEIVRRHMSAVGIPSGLRLIGIFLRPRRKK